MDGSSNARFVPITLCPDSFWLQLVLHAGQTFGMHETRLQPDSMKDWVIRKPFMESLPKPADHTQDYHYLKCSFAAYIECKHWHGLQGVLPVPVSGCTAKTEGF